jgi:hypothetical protein
MKNIGAADALAAWYRTHCEKKRSNFHRISPKTHRVSGLKPANKHDESDARRPSQTYEQFRRWIIDY